MDGKIEASAFDKFPLPANVPKRASVVIYPGAYAKMAALIQSFSTEVGWHGFCHRDPGCANRFILEDIVVYPQTVTGTAISTDEARHGDWLDSFDDESFHKLRFHGHSHVNMGVFSSATDDDLQRDLTNMLRQDDFYLFFIMNKRMEVFARLYDNKFGIVWETGDLDISIADETVDLPTFLSEAKAIVKEAPVAVAGAKHQAKAGGCLFDAYDQPYGYWDKDGNWVTWEGSAK